MTTSIRIPRGADLLITLHQPTSDQEIVRLRSEIREHFSGHRAIIVRACDVTFTPLVRRWARTYPLSILAHVGK